LTATEGVSKASAFSTKVDAGFVFENALMKLDRFQKKCEAVFRQKAV
jgi:hypothetical protein